MRIDKRVGSALEAVGDIQDGSSILLGGFGESGVPELLVRALVESGATGLTVISNTAGTAESGAGLLFKADRVGRIICTYPRSRGSIWFERRYAEGKVALELVPQGTLTERIRAAGAGIPAFYVPAAIGTEFVAGKETREFGGRVCTLEHALAADVALIRAQRADRWGNLTYHSVARNYSPTMAAAAHLCVVEVNEPIVDIGELDPEIVITPGVYVDRLVEAALEQT
jgi:3-oxoadipate CoA-transferase alpha subunit